MTTTYKVDGMTCCGCAKAVETTIKAIAPTAEVKADAAAGTVQVTNVTDQQMAQAIDDAGFTLVGRV